MDSNYCINQKMSVYTFSKSNKSLLIEESVTSLTINGSNNQITIKAKIPNLVVNGNHNHFNAQHRRSCLGNVVLNGSYNSISAANANFNKVAVGANNTVNNHQISAFAFGNSFNVHNSFQNANININISHSNVNEFFGSDNGFEYESNSERDSDDDDEGDGEGEYDNDSEEEQEDEEIENEEEVYEQSLENERRELERRDELILNLNEFQFKHASKYIGRIEEKCAICLEKFNAIDIVKQFACGEHIYHKKCLLLWLKKSDICPLCKYCLLDGILKESIDL